MRMTGMGLQRATQGRWHGEPPAMITGLSTDSRQLHPGDAFLALRGPHFDGHAFAAQAVQKGANALIGDSNGIQLWRAPLPPVLEVTDTLAGLGHIAKAWRQGFSGRLVAITGSFGKTSVRAMLAHILFHLGLKIAATRGNFNNLVGVPKTLLACQGDEDVVIVECGISEPGEMARLADMVRPDITVITGIGMAHSQDLGGLGDIVREKALLLEATSNQGWCALAGGVAELLERYGHTPRIPVLAMDLHGSGAARWYLRQCTLTLELGGSRAQVEMLLPARHWAENMALAASIACRLCGADLAEVAAALRDWRPLQGRLSLLPGPNGSHILDDAYNANPASMAAALDTLRQLPGRHFAVLGDMAELGNVAAASHAELDVTGLAGLILVGPLMRAVLNRHSQAQWTEDAGTALELARRWPLAAGDHVLVKGSRSMGLETVAAGLAETTHAV